MESYKTYTLDVEKEWMSAILNFPISEMKSKILYHGSVVMLTPYFKDISTVLTSITYADIVTRITTETSFDSNDLVVFSYDKRKYLERMTSKYYDVSYVSLGFIVDLLSQLGKDKPVIPDKDLYTHHLTQMYEIANEELLKDAEMQEKQQLKSALEDELEEANEENEMNISQRLYFTDFYLLLIFLH